MKFLNTRLVLISFIILMLLNEFTLVYLDKNPPLSEPALFKIRIFNLLIFLLPVYFVLIQNLYSFLRINIFLDRFIFFSNFILKITFPTFITIILFDIVLGLFGYGYDTHYRQENIERFPSPYDSFSGKPNSKSEYEGAPQHNEFGFRGNFVKSDQLNLEDISIAFFGGSTGYNGNPPISDLVSKRIQSKGLKSIPYNFSSTSSSHTQHLHRLLKFHNKFNFDIVIFYGGGNETLQYLDFDRRPGFPYNFFYRQELSPFLQTILRYSSIVGEFDKHTGLISGISEIKKNYSGLQWKVSIIDKYWEDLESANRLTQSMIKPNSCVSPIFISVLQPANSNFFLKKHKEMWNLLVSSSSKKNLDYHLDLSKLDKKMLFSDIIHIDQQSRLKISDAIVDFIFPIIKNKCL